MIDRIEEIVTTIGLWVSLVGLWASVVLYGRELISMNL